MSQIQKFIAKQINAIHTADPSALVSVGSWSERSQTSSFGWKNFYADACLQAFGDAVDFIQIHTYDYQGQWSGTSPFQKLAAEFNNTKPLVIGEFSSSASPGMSIQSMYQYAKNNGYEGAWAWQAAGGPQSDTQGVLQLGMAAINNTYGGVTFAPTPLSSNSSPNSRNDASSTTAPLILIFVSAIVL